MFSQAPFDSGLAAYAQGERFVVAGFNGFRDSGLKSRESGIGNRDSGFGIRDSGFGIRVSGFGIEEPGIGDRNHNIFRSPAPFDCAQDRFRPR